MATETARALAEARNTLRASAAVHKRSAGAHRRALRETMEALHTVERVAREHGIPLEGMTVETEIQERGQSDGAGADSSDS